MYALMVKYWEVIIAILTRKNMSTLKIHDFFFRSIREARSQDKWQKDKDKNKILKKAREKEPYLSENIKNNYTELFL